MLPFVRKLEHQLLRPYVRHAHLWEYPLTMGPRIIYDHEIIVVLEGYGFCYAEGHELAYEEGSIILVPPQTAHQFKDLNTNGKHAHWAVHFDWERQHLDAPELWEEVEGEGDNETEFSAGPHSPWIPSVSVIRKVPPEIRSCIERVVESFQSRDTYKALSAQIALLEFLLRLARGLAEGGFSLEECARRSRTAAVSKDRGDMRGLASELERLAQATPVDEAEYAALWASIPYSEAYLRKLFKGQTGLAPHAYFTMLRLQRAARLLIDTEQSIKEIAWVCGYMDAKYFSRLFRQYEGMSPQEYRQSLKK